MSAYDMRASILHHAQNLDDDFPYATLSALDGPVPPISLLLSHLAAIHTVGVATTPVAVAAAVAYPTSAAHVAVLSIFCRHAQPLMTHF
jgi:hypothetical protein